MKSLITFLLISLTVLFADAQSPKYALVIHGGAGTMDRKELTPAIEKTIVILEDSPLFNAGKGAVFTHEGLVELDASVMDGQALKAGAIAGVRDIKNPIRVARKVMEQSEHVMLTGAGASQFAKEQDFEPVDNSYFYTEKRYKALQELLKKERETTCNDKHGTVGCVALDRYGNIAAGTSTGGMNNKKYGRIGDSPIIGAGTYANNKTGAFSCTGHGEYYIRLGFSRDISALMEYKKLPLKKACREEIKKLTELGGTGGVIGIDKRGNVAMEFNTSGMFRGSIKSTGEQEVAIFK